MLPMMWQAQHMALLAHDTLQRHDEVQVALWACWLLHD
jgi:hypothetical protein